jgi:hypothetical protein
VHHAGEQGDEFHYYTNAYSNNVMYEIGDIIATFHAEGGDFRDLEKLQEAMAAVKPLAADVGVMAEESPLRDPANHDFRPVPGTAVEGRGVRSFVPWSLYATVAEWNFTRNNMNPEEVIDEHWYMTRYHRGRDSYENRPMYPLTGVGISGADYLRGPLEDWAFGTLRLDGEQQYLTLSNATLDEPYRFQVRREQVVVEGQDLRSPEIWEPNFIVEFYVKVQDGDSGVLLSKMSDQAGYALEVNAGGNPVFTVAADGRKAQAVGQAAINDGRWHHVLAQASQEDGKLTVFVDGRTAGTADSLPDGSMLENEADLYVGGTPDDGHLACSLEFVRIALGTLEQSRTSIEELHTWQFDGPFLRDFTGARTGESRAAGAIDLK